MSAKNTAPLAAADLESRSGTNYPEPYRDAVAGRSRRALGDAFGLNSFGVNLTTLQPGAASAQRHWHTHEDEFVYILTGELVLVSEAGEQVLTPGMVAGFQAGIADGHQLINRGNAPASYLEIGDRHRLDEVYYPDIDLQYVQSATGGRAFVHRDGEPYDQT